MQQIHIKPILHYNTSTVYFENSLHFFSLQRCEENLKFFATKRRNCERKFYLWKSLKSFNILKSWIRILNIVQLVFIFCFIFERGFLIETYIFWKISIKNVLKMGISEPKCPKNGDFKVIFFFAQKCEAFAKYARQLKSTFF